MDVDAQNAIVKRFTKAANTLELMVKELHETIDTIKL